jgi:class 3 adenylate cyclase/tetratricopeptide (TPR) repeat protein
MIHAMNCSRCGTENPPGAKFCRGCGIRLDARCPACEHSNLPGSRFCNECGFQLVSDAASQSAASVPSTPKRAEERTRPSERTQVGYTPKHLADKILKARSALEGERRHVTVLFADLAGFSTLAEQRDPEDVHVIVERCFEMIATEVHRFEGTINQYTGDGVMALFGAPIAHEDAPRRAAHAALAIQHAVRDLSRELAPRLAGNLEMRIGLNTGPVVVGKIGDDLRMDYTAVGDTTNVAARLQQNARPGSVLVGASTHRLIAGYFETLDLGELSVKGHAPVQAFEVVRARGRKARLDVESERGLTPLVGRDREIATLVELFGHVREGRGQVVFLAGEAGIGKSRLLLEFRRRLAAAGDATTWLEGRCISFGQSSPLLPVVEQLRQNFGIDEFDGEPEIIAKVEHGMRRLGGLEPHVPFVRYLLSVDPGDHAVIAMDAAQRRKRIFDAVLAMSLRGAARRPLVFVFEDLHWVDTSTEVYLAALIDSVAATHILIVATYRLGYSPPFGTRSFQTRMTLSPLSEADALAMAGRMLGVEGLPVEVTRALLDKAEGVPLFVEEVTKTFLDLGILERDSGGFRVVRPIRDAAIPNTIHDIIMARLDRLGEEGKRTVQLASVIGRQFLRRLLERIAGLTGELEGFLQELKALEIIYEQGLLPEPAYIFKHAVIQDVAYQSLLVQRRKELHHAVGRAIEELYPDRLAEHYEELAHHFGEGEQWDEAFRYSVLAGDRAAHAFASAEARRHYAQALEVAGRARPAPSERTLASVHEKLGGILYILAEFEAAVSEFERALALIRRFGDRKQEVATLLGLANVYNWGHRIGEVLATVNAALAIAIEIGDTAGQAGCHALRGEARGGVYGPVVEAMRDSSEALRLAREAGDPRLLAQCLTFAGRHLEWHGEYDVAVGHLREGLELARLEHSGYLVGLSLYHLGHAALARGDYEGALEHYRSLRDYAEAAGDKLYLARLPNLFGGVSLETYDLDEAIRFNSEGDETSRRLWPWPEPRGHSLWKLGLAHLYRGNHGSAERAFREAESLRELDTWGRWTWEISLWRSRGELLLTEAKYDEAWILASRSLEAATQCRQRKHVARALRLQGEIMAAQGRLADATRALTASLDQAHVIGTARESWIGHAALGRVLTRLGQDGEAEAQLTAAAHAIESIATKLVTPDLRQKFLAAEPVADVFRTLGRTGPGSR